MLLAYKSMGSGKQVPSRVGYCVSYNDHMHYLFIYKMNHICLRFVKMKTQCERSLEHAVEYMLYGNGNGYL